MVDDSCQILDRLKDLLSEMKSEVELLTAGTFSKAVEILSKNRFDIALLDIHLPDGNGIELLKLIKKDQPGVKTIMISNQSGDYYRDLCKKLGAIHFIDKSKDFELLPNLIDELV